MRTLVTCSLLALLSCGHRVDAQMQIKAKILAYARSIDLADTDAARSIWADEGAISFIHPLGHERGWDQIRANFYGKIMFGMLSSRNLRMNDITVHVRGTSAVAEFYWVFDATWKKDGTALHTEGRETQVWQQTGGGWRLVHVHYSGMPAAVPERGL